MNLARTTLYATICICFAAAGTMDLARGIATHNAADLKLGVVALMFAVVNATIFFWR